jgi:trans-aconitate 2-methyltransferase
VFSNSALQWLDDQARLLPRLLMRVAEAGALAFQVPASWDAPVAALARELAAAPRWRGFFAAGAIREWRSQSLAFYYDVLAPHAAQLDLWETEYVMIVPGVEAIAAWYKGSGLRPFLQALPDAASRARFEHEYLDRLPHGYPRQPNGRVLFPFRRRFVLARR